jgi:transcriptional regulator with XRE-family HTH domain
MRVGDRFGREFGIARRIAGLSQLAVATRVRTSQARLSRIERGAVSPDLITAERLAAAVGYRLTVSLVPDAGVRLRDSGQLDLAEAIRRESHPSWKVRLEAPIGPPPDRRAGDMLFESRADAALFEIERLLADFQAQFRAAQLKRAALAERLGRVVRLVIAVPDLPRARRLITPHSALIRAALPISSRRAWAAIRSGTPIGGYALLWVRTARIGSRPTRSGSRPAAEISPEVPLW